MQKPVRFEDIQDGLEFQPTDKLAAEEVAVFCFGVEASKILSLQGLRFALMCGDDVQAVVQLAETVAASCLARNHALRTPEGLDQETAWKVNFRAFPATSSAKNPAESHRQP